MQRLAALGVTTCAAGGGADGRRQCGDSGELNAGPCGRNNRLENYRRGSVLPRPSWNGSGQRTGTERGPSTLGWDSTLLSGLRAQGRPPGVSPGVPSGRLVRRPRAEQLAAQELFKEHETCSTLSRPTTLEDDLNGRFDDDRRRGWTPTSRHSVGSPARRVRLLAPAGSGKTHSLLWRCLAQHEATPNARAPDSSYLTFTQAARDEIVTDSGSEPISPPSDRG